MKIMKYVTLVLVGFSILPINAFAIVVNENNGECYVVDHSVTSQCYQVMEATTENNAEEVASDFLIPTFSITQHIEDYDMITHDYKLKVDFDYEYFGISYQKTSGIEMHSSSEIITNDAIKSIIISYEVLPLEANNSSVFNFREDSILLTGVLYNGESIVGTCAVHIWILLTGYGLFVTDIDPLINRRNYSRYLLHNQLVDENTYEELNVSFHRHLTTEKVTSTEMA